jgi:metal-responsive CopG/Arc/MetJ family transcriptional regulator
MTFWVKNDLLGKLEEVCKVKGYGRSTYIRDAVKEAVKKDERKKKREEQMV